VRTTSVAWVTGLWLLAGCGGGGGGSPATADGQWVGDAAAGRSAQVQVLMLGNSHTSSNDLPGKLDAMLRSGLGGRSVGTALAPGSMFLDERVADPESMAVLRGRAWTVVVLQAQKYSSSGLYEYSTAEAAALAAEARRLGALPVLFPEWPRRGIAETARIWEPHVRIATEAPACIAPVGQAFDLAAQRMPALVLHASDGNHSSPAGAYLAALVLYATVSGRSPLDLADATPPGVDPATQLALRQVAADAVAAVPPRQYCPLDPPQLGVVLRP
jgi:hypothetical protein